MPVLHDSAMQRNDRGWIVTRRAMRCNRTKAELATNVARASRPCRGQLVAGEAPALRLDRDFEVAEVDLIQSEEIGQMLLRVELRRTEADRASVGDEVDDGELGGAEA